MFFTSKYTITCSECSQPHTNDALVSSEPVTYFLACCADIVALSAMVIVPGILLVMAFSWAVNTFTK